MSYDFLNQDLKANMHTDSQICKKTRQLSGKGGSQT